MGDILYDCYDENGNHIDIIFAKDCADLLYKNPKVKYVQGMDYLTRRSTIHKVTERGLFPTPYRHGWEVDKSKSAKEV